NQTRFGPIFDGLNLTGFKLTYSDGSFDEYKYVISAGETADALLTSRFDSASNNTARFTYVFTNGVHRLTQVTDIDNRICTLFYTNASFPSLATEIDDPFNRKAYLKYNSSGQLTNITDPAGINSGIAYDSQGFVSTLTTPYGTTTFTATGGTNDYLGGDIVSRSLKILDPNGGTQLYLYR